jgi:SpoVK/Ycf46/Vps4 family AAA+-type ATPase
MGFLEKSEITIADRPKLIGQWLGETAIKTKKVLDSARGGILLIDEAYSLGDQEGGKDSFSKECIDTINQYLSEHVDELVCIIAGYKEDLDKCFFAVNQGLARRFPWRYEMDKYTPDNMYSILDLQIKKQNWSTNVETSFLVNMFKENSDLFNNNGGDTHNFLCRGAMFSYSVGQIVCVPLVSG